MNNKNFVHIFDVNNINSAQIPEPSTGTLLAIVEKISESQQNGRDEELNVWASKSADILDGYRDLISSPKNGVNHFFLVIESDISVVDFINLSKNGRFVITLDLLLSAYLDEDRAQYFQHLKGVQSILLPLTQPNESASEKALQFHHRELESADSGIFF